MQLRDLILRGEFAPGHKLAEQQLAERLGASRTPVRAALVTLRAGGPGRGQRHRRLMSGAAVHRRSEVADAIAVRGVLEGHGGAAGGRARREPRQLAAGAAGLAWTEGDAAAGSQPAGRWKSYARLFAAMNDRFHAPGAGSQRQPGAAARGGAERQAAVRPGVRAMLPMQGQRGDWTATGCCMRTSPAPHAVRRAASAARAMRAQALGSGARGGGAVQNMRLALERRR
jgi:GntR family transcriptional regulator of vanillate catabolism